MTPVLFPEKPHKIPYTGAMPTPLCSSYACSPLITLYISQARCQDPYITEVRNVKVQYMFTPHRRQKHFFLYFQNKLYCSVLSTSKVISHTQNGHPHKSYSDSFSPKQVLHLLVHHPNLITSSASTFHRPVTAAQLTDLIPKTASTQSSYTSSHYPTIISYLKVLISTSRPPRYVL
uniref:Uncharacterized protein n=1 Tax=Xenopus tropicalis TaxID=8364 RepID=A0A1B8Y6L8_XENTR